MSSKGLSDKLSSSNYKVLSSETAANLLLHKLLMILLFAIDNILIVGFTEIATPKGSKFRFPKLHLLINKFLIVLLPEIPIHNSFNHSCFKTFSLISRVINLNNEIYYTTTIWT